jgi:hypothetical protein
MLPWQKGGGGGGGGAGSGAGCNTTHLAGTLTMQLVRYHLHDKGLVPVSVIAMNELH